MVPASSNRTSAFSIDDRTFYILVHTRHMHPEALNSILLALYVALQMLLGVPRTRQLANYRCIKLSLHEPNAQTLDAGRFTHLPVMPCMANLEVLYLHDNQISAVQPMHSLPSLRLVNLSFNRLTKPATLTAFLPLPALAELYLNGNPLEKDPR